MDETISEVYVCILIIFLKWKRAVVIIPRVVLTSLKFVLCATTQA